jgi:hypothetical protein
MELNSTKSELEENRILAEQLVKCFIKREVLQELRPIFILRRVGHLKNTINKHLDYLTDDN